MLPERLRASVAQVNLRCPVGVTLPVRHPSTASRSSFRADGSAERRDHCPAIASSSGATAGDRAANEIGSASCRERVCQYGEISVVAVTFNKKGMNCNALKQ